MSEFMEIFVLNSMGENVSLESLQISLQLADLLAKLVGSELRQKVTSCSSSEVLREMERLQIFSRHGAAVGFQTLLPRGTYIESCFEKFNSEFLSELNAVRVDFPIVYDGGVADIVELTKGYEDDGRVFTVEDSDDSLRLSYAADPGLFSWARGRKMKAKSLPCAIYSPTQGLRKWKRGELGAVNRLRQFTIPDVHVFCGERDSLGKYTELIGLGKKGLEQWFGDQYAQFIDIDREFFCENPSFVKEAARASGGYTVVRVLRKRPRYYAMRSGLVVNAGFEHLMVYNLQYDDTSARLFKISSDEQDKVIVIHATAAMGLARVVPAIIAQALMGEKIETLPASLLRDAIVILPTHESFCKDAENLASVLEKKGIGVSILLNNSLGKRLSALKAQWSPWAIVFGEREKNGGEIEVQCVASKRRTPLANFLAKEAPLITKCRPLLKMNTAFDLFIN